MHEAKTMRYRVFLGQNRQNLRFWEESSRTCLVGSLGALLGAEHGQFRLLHHLKHRPAPHPFHETRFTKKITIAPLLFSLFQCKGHFYEKRIYICRVRFQTKKTFQRS
jgi:hypothetical protein